MNQFVRQGALNTTMRSMDILEIIGGGGTRSRPSVVADDEGRRRLGCPFVRHTGRNPCLETRFSRPVGEAFARLISLPPEKRNGNCRARRHGRRLNFLRDLNSASADIVAAQPYSKGWGFRATSDSLAARVSLRYRWAWKQNAHESWAAKIKDTLPQLIEAVENARQDHHNGLKAFSHFIDATLENAIRHGGDEEHFPPLRPGHFQLSQRCRGCNIRDKKLLQEARLTSKRNLEVKKCFSSKRDGICSMQISLIRKQSQ